MWDCIIIGGGLAGLIAGIRSAERGKRVLLISEGTGSLTYASGALDFGQATALISKDNHPYQRFGVENIRRAYDYIQEIIPEYEGKWEETQPVLTPLGEIRESNLLTAGLSARPLSSSEIIVLVEPRNLKDFFSLVYRENLQRSFPRAEVIMKPVQVRDFTAWYELGKSIPAVDYAKYWRTAAGIEQLARVFKDIATEMTSNNGSADVMDGIPAADVLSKTVVVFPGLCTQFHSILQEKMEQIPFKVVETSLMPPSPSGMLLYDNLKRLFKNLDGEMMLGAKAVSAVLEDNRCKEISVKVKGKNQTLKANTFVLANGGIFGGGIEVTPKQVREPIFNLPVYKPEQWAKETFLEQQPYALSGIEVDSVLRPVNKKGEIIAQNLYICGRMLAHWDPWTEHCGSGVSITSGYLAGNQI